MKVKILRIICGSDGTKEPGAICEVDAEIGAAWVTCGAAEKIEVTAHAVVEVAVDPLPVETAKMEHLTVRARKGGRKVKG